MDVIDADPSFQNPSRTVARWTGAWTLAGVALGILAMFLRIPPMAESGARPTNFGFYAFWIPVLAVPGAALGFLLGIVVTIASAIVRGVRTRRGRAAFGAARYLATVPAAAAAATADPEAVATDDEEPWE